MFRKSLLGFYLMLASLPCVAQVQVGLYTYGSFDTPGFDTIDRGSLNIHFSIPVINKAGRGMNFQYAITYDGLIWSPSVVSGAEAWTPNITWGFNGLLGNNLVGYISYNQKAIKCNNPDPDGGANQRVPGVWYLKYVYYDAFGRGHPLDYSETSCISSITGDAPTITGTGLATDGSGYTFDGYNVVAVNGTAISALFNNNGGLGSITDTNGNEITNNGDGTFVDTTGTTALTITGNGTVSSPTVYTYKTTTGTAAVTVSYRAYTVQTAFGCSGIGEYNQAATLVDRITFADQSFYQFTYEPTPGNSSNVTGRIASVTLPQGGVVSYQYTGGSNGISCTDGTTTGITRGITGGTRTYARTSITSTTSSTSITDGLNNQSTFSFVTAGTPTEFFEMQRSIYNGAASGTPLLSLQTCYNAVAPPCSTSVPTLPLSQIDTYETLDGIQMHGATAKYNTYGMQTEADVYDFGGASARGARLSKEVWQYTSGIASHGTIDTVFDSSGNMAGQTTYGYDLATPTASSGVPQHVGPSVTRGNLNMTTQWTGSETLYTSFSYEDTGTLLTSTTQSGTTTLSYDSTFTYNTGAALPTPSSGVALASSESFDTSNTGLPLTLTDANGQVTQILAYDSMLRPTEVDSPGGGKTTFTYSPTQVGKHTYQTSSVYSDTETQYDGYGRPSRAEVANGQSGSGWYQTDTCYDANGNAAFTSYPYQGTGFGTGKVCSGAGDTYTYDALGRVTSVVRANGETRNIIYLGRATKSIDENSVTRISQIDGLGRTAIVCEISSNSSMPGSGSPASCGTDIAGTGFITTYGYALATTGFTSATPTTTITQGAQTRTFTTDWLGRPTSVVEPERGTTTYSYAYNSTGLEVTRQRPRANQPYASVLTSTTTQYDTLGRVLSISYNDGTPTKTFVYDKSAGVNFSDLAQANLKGRLSLAAISGVAGTAYSYDPVGRISNLDECLPSGCGTSGYNRQLHYTYDLAGDLLTSTDGAGVTSSYTLSPASEVLSLTSSLSNSTDPTGILSNVQYGPNGPVSYNLGNGLTGLYSYDALGRLSGATVSSGGTQVYGFANGWKGQQLTGSADSVLAQGSTYGYDEFNRLTSRTVNSGTGPNYGWVYDRYGNRLQQNMTGGSGSGSTFTASVNPANNQLVGYSYDAAGNMTNDTFHTYTYDAEGNITAVDGGQTAQYVYNAQNQRVRAAAGGTATEYVFSAAGQRVSEWNGTTRAQLKGKYYWGGAPVAYYANGAAHFEHQDWLGTERLRTAYNGGVEGSYNSQPWGDGHATQTGSDLDANHYAQLDYDAESDTDHAQFRQYSNAQGRWLSPDPYDGSYDASNPQSMNRYVYALNNPLRYVDPLGLVLCDYGRNDTTGGEDWEDAENAEECTTSGGTVVTDTTSVTVNGNDPSDLGTTIEIIMENNEQIILVAGGSGVGGVGGSSAPNNATQNKQLKCAGEALKKNGVALALDAASLGVDAFGPEAQYAKLGIGLGLSTASMINSAASHDMTGTGLGMGSYLKAPTELAATSAGWGWAKWVPFAGAAMDVASAYHDGSQAYSDYSSCMAGHR
jgi:RHS repeat-associated protein